MEDGQQEAANGDVDVEPVVRSTPYEAGMSMTGKMCSLIVWELQRRPTSVRGLAEPQHKDGMMLL